MPCGFQAAPCRLAKLPAAWRSSLLRVGQQCRVHSSLHSCAVEPEIDVFGERTGTTLKIPLKGFKPLSAVMSRFSNVCGTRSLRGVVMFLHLRLGA
jgi:hypothetical protein